MDNCWAFLDGTHVRVCRPGEDQEELYTGQKKCHTIKFQAVTTPDGIIVHLGGPFSGRRHDARILTMSKLLSFLAEHSVGLNGRLLVIYGDEGYSRRAPVLAPFHGGEDPAEVAANEAMRRPHLCVEWAFAFISNNWSFSNERQKLRTRLMRVGMYYPVQALLANLQLCYDKNSSTRSFYQVAAPSAEEYLTPREDWDDERVVMEQPDYFDLYFHNEEDALHLMHGGGGGADEVEVGIA